MQKSDASSFTSQLSALAATRLVLNTGLRFAYPYAPALARGLGVPREAIYYLISLRNLTGFSAPIFGPLSERFGRRAILALAMALFGAGSLLVVLWPTYWFVGAALIITGIAKVLYDPAMQAHVGDEVPYERRGRAVAVTEYSWSLSLLIGVPLIGVAMQRQGWTAPFFWLGLGGLASVVILWKTISTSSQRDIATTRMLGIVTLLRENRIISYASVYMVLFITANEMLFIVFGGWMEDSFNLSLTSLGIAAGIIGGAELLGETIAGLSVDRFGKRPVIILTGSLTALFNLVLPFTSSTLIGALLTLFALFMAFEITIVGGIPLMTELVPGARAAVMSILLTAMFAGRTIGSLLGPIIWNAFGFTVSGLIWAVITAAAVVVLALLVHEQR
jgi:predicted MFS family arabinose efflux permease